MTLERGHNSTNADNLELKKNTGQLFFKEESVYEISKPYFKMCLDRQAQRNMPLQLFQTWGHKQ